jgi:acetyltransferase-like isoleucine patch superfamily enzyme
VAPYDGKKARVIMNERLKVELKDKQCFIDDSAEIGSNFRFGRFIIIEEDVQIGMNVELGNFVRIMPGTRIGNNVTIMDYVKLMPGTIIGNNCKLDDYVNTSGYVEIGSGVATTRIKYPKVVAEEQEKEEWIVLKKGCMVGSRALLLAGTTVGEGAVVAAGAIVTKDCEPYGVYIGCPAKLARSRSTQ